MNESIHQHIKTLPPLDNTIVKIQAICADDNGTSADLAKVIEKDPMLTANILRSANSPLYGFSREINNITRAVSLFGMATIRGFALSSAIKKSFKIDLSPYDITDNDFLNIAVMQNALTYTWYSKVNPAALTVLSPASFMLEVGKIVLANELLESSKANEFKTKLKQNPSLSALSELENQMLDITNEVVAAKIFEQWNLENELVDAIMYVNNPDEAPQHIKMYCKALQVVKSAINIFHQLDEESVNATLLLLDQHGFAHDKFLESVSKVKAGL